jgi:hypothetical protein
MKSRPGPVRQNADLVRPVEAGTQQTFHITGKRVQHAPKRDVLPARNLPMHQLVTHNLCPRSLKEFRVPELSRSVDLDSIYERTPAGQNEILSHHAKLSPLQRHLLSMVTGYTATKDILALLGLDEIPHEAITRLLSAGLIQAAGQSLQAQAMAARLAKPSFSARANGATPARP